MRVFEGGCRLQSSLPSLLYPDPAHHNDEETGTHRNDLLHKYHHQRRIDWQTGERRRSARVSEAFSKPLTGLTAPSAYQLLQMNGRMRHHCTRVRGRMQTPTERAIAGGERGHTPGAHPASRRPSVVSTRELVISSRSNAYESHQRVQCGGSVRPPVPSLSIRHAGRACARARRGRRFRPGQPRCADEGQERDATARSFRHCR
jgi:hypothetical protein